MRAAIIGLAVGWGCLGGYLLWLVNHPLESLERTTPGERALEEIWVTKAWREDSAGKGKKAP